VISIYGPRIGTSTATTATINNGFYPKTLAGVQVTLNGMNMPLLYLSANKITAVVPIEIGPDSSATIRVNGTSVTPAFSVWIGDSAPEAFPIVLNQDAFHVRFGSSFNKANLQSERPAVKRLPDPYFCFAQSTDERTQKVLLADPRYQFSQAELDVDAFRLYKLAAGEPAHVAKYVFELAQTFSNSSSRPATVSEAWPPRYSTNRQKWWTGHFEPLRAICHCPNPSSCLSRSTCSCAGVISWPTI